MYSVQWYLENIRYADGGRGPIECDCYGMARLVRHHVYGLPLLPEYAGVDPTDKADAAPKLRQVVSSMSPCGEVASAFVLAYTGTIGGHCAVLVEMDGRMGVLECDTHIDARWTPLRKWRRLWSRLEFYT